MCWNVVGSIISHGLSIYRLSMQVKVQVLETRYEIALESRITLRPVLLLNVLPACLLAGPLFLWALDSIGNGLNSSKI